MELSRKQKMLLHRSAQEAGYGDAEDEEEKEGAAEE